MTNNQWRDSVKYRPTYCVRRLFWLRLAVWLLHSGLTGDETAVFVCKYPLCVCVQSHPLLPVIVALPSSYTMSLAALPGNVQARNDFIDFSSPSLSTTLPSIHTDPLSTVKLLFLHRRHVKSIRDAAQLMMIISCEFNPYWARCSTNLFFFFFFPPPFF